MFLSNDLAFRKNSWITDFINIELINLQYVLKTEKGLLISCVFGSGFQNQPFKNFGLCGFVTVLVPHLFFFFFHFFYKISFYSSFSYSNKCKILLLHKKFWKKHRYIFERKYPLIDQFVPRKWCLFVDLLASY